MLFKLLILFIFVPLVELYLLLRIGGLIGALPTVLLVILTGILGGYLAKREGLSVLTRIKERLNSGELPGDELLDGAFILISGALLITPGILTDFLGFLGLIPPTRALLKRFAIKRFQGTVARGATDVEFKVENRTR